MDVKMGTQTYEPDAPMEKRRREHSKYPQQGIFGMRIVGMHIYDPTHPDADDSGYVQVRKEFGRSLVTRQEVTDGLKRFFTTTNGGMRTRNVANILMLLQLLRRWFDDNDCLCFYSSSILLVYEGDETCSAKHLTNMKMVDFGHVRREVGGDHGYVLGLRNLSSMLNDLVTSHTPSST
mmetsp:Transcript_28152/g.65118  ORF Transcript_28152/g.65118 Transcript_28152/m.65118 type:complete len:178 (+) Transcript_28152:2-535(+)